jgi:hypothetical protein
VGEYYRNDEPELAWNIVKDFCSQAKGHVRHAQVTGE